MNASSHSALTGAKNALSDQMNCFKPVCNSGHRLQWRVASFERKRLR
jgi:hypothetical protein